MSFPPRVAAWSRFVTALVAGVLVAWQPTGAADDALALVLDLATREDPEFRSLGLERIRVGVKGEAATRACAALLEKLPPARQVELARALADRGDAAALPALVSLLKTAQDPTVRAAMLAGIGALGGAGEVGLLLQSLRADDPERSAARRALVTIRGADAVRQIVAAATSGDPSGRSTLVEILGERRVRTALPEIGRLVTDPDAAVRRAAFRVLGGLGGAAEMPALITGLVQAADGGERQEVERAILAACTRRPGAEAATESALTAFRASPEGDRAKILPTLAAVGGPKVMAIVDELVASPGAATRALGLQALARWPDATVAPRLVELVGAARDPAERELLVGALIRIAPLPDNKLDDARKLELVKQTMALCATDVERSRLLERASAIRTLDTFRFVLPYLDQPALATPACRSIVELAHHRQLREAHQAEFNAALDRVTALTTDAELVERATRYKEGKTWERKR